MKKFILIALAFTLSAAQAQAAFVLPKSYKAVLDCPASLGAPNFMVAKKSDSYFLASKSGRKVKMIELSTIDGDMGYLTYGAVNEAELGSLSSFVSWIYIYNDEEEREDPENALITWGEITLDGRDGENQECKATGKNAVN